MGPVQDVGPLGQGGEATVAVEPTSLDGDLLGGQRLQGGLETSVGFRKLLRPPDRAYWARREPMRRLRE
jgi:hypothetical protein